MDLTTKQKLAALLARGWKFERFSRNHKRWVPITTESRRAMRAINYHFAAEFSSHQEVTFTGVKW